MGTNKEGRTSSLLIQIKRTANQYDGGVCEALLTSKLIQRDFSVMF